jgi:hypothetical protein
MAGLQAWNPARPGAAAGLYQSAYTDELGRAIIERAAAGESLSAICRTPGMPDRHTVRNWAAAQPEFGAALDVIRWQAAKLAPRKYVEKLAVENVRAADARAQARLERGAEDGNVLICRFERGPGGEVLCDPPRTEAEEQAWERAYGKPYEGPYGYRAYRQANGPARPKWVRAPKPG